MNLFVPSDPRSPVPQPQWRRMLWVSIGLVYLFIWPLAGLFRHGRPVAEVVTGLLALVSFVAVFLALAAVNTPQDERTGRAAWALLAVITAMTIAYPLLLGRDWDGLPIYLGVAYAMALPFRWTRHGILAATVLTLLLCTRTHGTGATTALLSFETLTIGMLMYGFRSSRILIAQLQEARDEVARLAANEERLRIARDLHDLLGHTLSLIVLKSEVAVRLADRDPARSLGEVRDIESVARQALTDVREAVSGYRRRTLAEELDGARATLAAAGVEASVAISGTPLPDPLDGLFGWAVREGVTNIVRHAGARTAVIAVARTRGTAVLEVTDDGRGPDSRGSGNGLEGLAERVAAAGGTTGFGPGVDGGFRLTIRVPLTATGHAAATPEPPAVEPLAPEPPPAEGSAPVPPAQELPAAELPAQQPPTQEPSAQEPSAQEPSAQEPSAPQRPGAEIPAPVAPAQKGPAAEVHAQRDAARGTGETRTGTSEVAPAAEVTSVDPDATSGDAAVRAATTRPPA